MCGICGIVRPHGAPPIPGAALDAMCDVQAHRGPDDSGTFLSAGVALGHRRLSIVDLATGHQPISNEDGTVQIVFNGEIYNHVALRHDLESRGHRYRTQSDTESIVHAYEEGDAAFPRRLRGMFAFAIWDAPRRRLTLARDHTGIKPLYYASLADGTLLFASEVKSLYASGLLPPPRVAVDRTEEYFATGHVSGTSTLLDGIQRLPAGAVLTWESGRVSLHRFWSLPAVSAQPAQPGTVRDLAASFWARFVDAVRSQLMSDVPLGVFLSGGLDSSLIVAAMRELGVEGIRSFSVGYREEDASELPWARLVASRMSTEHHEVLVDGKDFFALLPLLTWHRDFPLTFSASVPLYAVARLAREHVTVVLTGEGSDELFGGYGRYPRALKNLTRARQLDRMLPAPLRRAAARAARRPRSGRWGDRLSRSFVAYDTGVAGSLLEPFAEWHGTWRERLVRVSSRGAAFGNLPSLLPTADVSAAPLEALLRYDQATYMEELLMKQDTMSMAASLESRVPFLDHLLVEWAATLPADAKLDGTTGKAVVRAAAQGRLPVEVLRGPKRGFLVPLDRWLRTVGADTVEAYLPAPDDALLDAGTARSVWSSHRGGNDHTGRIWRLLAFQLWRSEVLPRLASATRVASNHWAAPPAALLPSTA